MPGNDALRPTVGGPLYVPGNIFLIRNRNWVENAPHIPCAEGAVRPPALANEQQFRFRHLLAVIVVTVNALDEAQVVDRKDVGPAKSEDQEHLGRPAANALDWDQFLDDRLILHRRPFLNLLAVQ